MVRTKKSQTRRPPMKLEALAVKVREERKAQGLSQTELAQLAGVSLNFLSQLETGKATVRIDKVLQVMATLGLEFKLRYGKSGITI